MEIQHDDNGADGRFPGVVFRGAGNLDEAAAAVRDACRRQGLECAGRSGAGWVEIAATQGRPRWRVALTHLPQRIDWRLERRGDELRVGADFSLDPWYRRLLTAGALVIAVVLVTAFVAGGRPAVQRSSGSSALLAGVVLLALLATGWFVRALGPLGGGRCAATLWHRIRSRISARGGHLGPVRHTMTRRYVNAMFGLMAGLVLLFLWWGLAGLVMAADAGDALLLLSFPVLAALVLMAGALVVAGRAGSEVRVEVLLPGMATGVFAVLFLALPLLPVLLGAGGPPPEPAAARFTLGVLAAGSLLVLGLGALAVAGAAHFAPTLRRLRRGRYRGVDRQAVADRRVLRVVRRVFVTLWILLGLAVVLELGLLTLALLTAAGLAPDTVGARVVAAWELLWNAAAGSPARGASGTALLPVSVAAAFGWFALALSVGQLGIARRRLGRRLRRGELAVRRHGEARRLEGWLARLGRRHGLASVALAVHEATAGIDAQAHRVGARRPRCYVEVSGGALRHLDAPRLRALVAHEAAHHLAGHAALFNRLRWLGRLTLVGDGFVQTLQHSFGYETEADGLAVRRLGVEADTLAVALRTLWEVNAARQLKSRRGVARDGLAAAAPPVEGGDDGASGWRGSWRLFLDQYVHPVNHHYWHPDPQERLALLGRAGEETET